jgi:hypothetical protein
MNLNADQPSTLPEWLSHINPSLVEGCAPELFETVREAYNTPGRFYHTWQHIDACLAEFALQSFDHRFAAVRDLADKRSSTLLFCDCAQSIIKYF